MLIIIIIGLNYLYQVDVKATSNFENYFEHLKG